MPRCPKCNNKIQLKIFGYNKQYHCDKCFASLVEDKRQNQIAIILMALDVIFIPLILVLLGMNENYIVLISCIGGLLIYNYIPKLKVKNET